MPCDADAATRGIASPVSAEPDDAGLSGSGETMAQIGCGSTSECSDDFRTLSSTRCHRSRNQVVSLVVNVTSCPLLQTWATTSEASPVLRQELREGDRCGVALCPVALGQIVRFACRAFMTPTANFSRGLRTIYMCVNGKTDASELVSRVVRPACVRSPGHDLSVRRER